MSSERQNEIKLKDGGASSGNKSGIIACVAVMVAAAVVYSSTLCTGLFPGFSASIFASHIGISPLVAPGHPVWSAIVKFISGGGAAGSAFRLNLFSMVMAVLSTGMLFHLVHAFVLFRSDSQKVLSKTRKTAALFAGIAASVAFAFSVPVWMTATRLHYQIFDFCMLLAITELFVLYFKSRKTLILFAFALLYGVAGAENLLVLLFGPLFLFYLLFYWYQTDGISLPKLFGMLLLFLIGLGTYWVAAKSFISTQEVSLYEKDGIGGVILEMFREQVRIVRLSIPSQRWLLILIFVVVPWVAMQAIASRALSESREWSVLLFHVAASICVLITLVNSAAVSPWGIYREFTAGAVLPVALYAMTAAVAGYLIAYWYIFVSNRAALQKHERSRPEVVVGTGLGYGFGWIVAVVIVFASLINGFEANGRRGNFADECARVILDNLDGRRWIVTDGVFDNHLSVEAARRGDDVHLIPLRNGDVFSVGKNERMESEIYTKRLEKIIDTDKDFASLNKVELKNALKLGVPHFIEVWMQADPTLIDRMAVMNAPDIFVAAGGTVVPSFLCFFGVREDPVPNDPEVGKIFDRYIGPEKLAQYKVFWNKFIRELSGDKDKFDPISSFRTAVLRQIGFVANNMGFLFEDLGRDEEAYLAYSSVRKIDPENVSALLNLVALLNRKKDDNFHPGEITRVEKEINDYIKNLKQKIHIWALSRTFGYVRDPVAFAQLGYTWAMSGQPGIAMADMRRAISLAKTDVSRLDAKRSMADMLLLQNDSEKSEAIYDEILSVDPEAEADEARKNFLRDLRRDAFVKKSRIEARRGMLDKAREWLDAARKDGIDAEKYSYESAALDLASGDAVSARIKLTALTGERPQNLQYWSLLAITEIMMGDFDHVSRQILPKMETIAGTPDNYIVQLTRGQLYSALGKDRYKDARAAFERAAYLNQSVSVQLLEHVLRIDFMLNDKENAEAHAGMIIRQNRQNGFANYIMGSIMLERGRRAEAEDYLRRSVSETKTPEALNDLAELLRQTGNFEEAEKQIRAAIDIAPDFYVIYDTLGGILAAAGRLEEAEQAYLKAIGLFGEDYRIHLNLAMLCFKRGNIVKTKELVAKIRARRGDLPPAEQEQLADLINKLNIGK